MVAILLHQSSAFGQWAFLLCVLTVALGVAWAAVWAIGRAARAVGVALLSSARSKRLAIGLAVALTAAVFVARAEAVLIPCPYSFKWLGLC